MILVLLGTQDAPFPRIVNLVEEALLNLAWDQEVVVQAGHTRYQSIHPWVKVTPFLTQSEFEAAIQAAEIVICHGGAGTMLTASQQEKQVIVCARKHAFAEHNNDHQSELVDKLALEGYVQAVQTVSEMQQALQLVQTDQFHPRRFDFVNDVVNHVEAWIDQLSI